MDKKISSAKATGTYVVPARTLPSKEYDVVVVGAGTAGVAAAIAAARTGARTAVIEAKGHPGGTVVEASTVLHSFFNMWKAFPGVSKRQVVKGIPQEIVDKMVSLGGSNGHAEMSQGFDYDSACTLVDPELFKYATFDLLSKAGVYICVNTRFVDTIVSGSIITGVIIESRSGREVIFAKVFVDCTGYGDLSARAGVQYSEPNDYPVGSSMGVGNVSLESYQTYLQSNNALTQAGSGTRSGKSGLVIRLNGDVEKLPVAFREAAKAIGFSIGTSTIHDNYFMHLELNYTMATSPTNAWEVSNAELELRIRQQKALELIRQYLPSASTAYIARTGQMLSARRARVIPCDYDITLSDIIEGKHFSDDVLAYGFHDAAPKYQIKNGGTFGIPYRALIVTGLDNLLAAGMLVTSNRDAHMSTRTTVCCMGMGQASGTAAALCTVKNVTTRALPYPDLKAALVAAGVYFETTAIDGTDANQRNPSFSLGDCSLSLTPRRGVVIRHNGHPAARAGATLTLESFDIRGKRLAAWRNFHLKNGAISLSHPPAAPGWVFMRLRAGKESVTHKVLLQ